MTTQNKYCALCPVELTEANRTNEHIIPNSIGGWPKVQDFICKSCNSKKGDDWDSEVYAQFNWIPAMIGIMRNRGSQSKELVTTASGIDYHILPDGTMVPAELQFNREVNDDDVKISFVARNDKEAKSKIKELHKKYPQIDVEEAIKHAKVQTSRLQEPLYIKRNLGGPLAGRSVVCTALAYAFSKGINPHSCENVQQFLHDPTAPSACCGFFFLREIVMNRPMDKTFLCVSIHGSKQAKRLMAYVEYYGLGRWLITLSNEYKGSTFVDTYAVDPTNQETIDLKIDWSLSENIIKKSMSGHGLKNAIYDSAEAFTLILIRFLSAKRTINKKSDAFTEEFLAKHGVGLDNFLPHEKGMAMAEEYLDVMINEIDHLLLGGLNAQLKKNDA